MSSTAEMATRILTERDWESLYRSHTPEQLRERRAALIAHLSGLEGDTKRARNRGYPQLLRDCREAAGVAQAEVDWITGELRFRRRCLIRTLLNDSTREQARIDDLSGQLAAAVDLRQAYLARAEALMLEADAE